MKLEGRLFAIRCDGLMLLLPNAYDDDQSMFWERGVEKIGDRTPKPVTRTVISSILTGTSRSLEPMTARRVTCDGYGNGGADMAGVVSRELVIVRSVPRNLGFTNSPMIRCIESDLYCKSSQQDIAAKTVLGLLSGAMLYARWKVISATLTTLRHDKRCLQLT